VKPMRLCPARSSRFLLRSRYTDAVIWRHRIAVLLLIVFAALPPAGALCAMTCLTASTVMTGHHGVAARQCDDASPVFSSARIGGHSRHDCRNHDAAVLEIAATPAHRADLIVVTGPALASGVVFPELTTLVAHRPGASFSYTPPPVAPSTATPLVLRV
jgi:hypothetical protein